MIGAKAAGSGKLVMGRCMIVGERLCVLYDSGVTHSFVLETCVKSWVCQFVSYNMTLWYPLQRRVWLERHLCVLGVQGR